MAFEYEIHDDFDKIVDEKGNSFIALRKLTWGGKGEPKLDLRKWYINSNGEETVGKGVSFLTEDGPHELAKVLVDNGYGHTNEILSGIYHREDFEECLENLRNGIDIINNSIGDDEDYYDPKEFLL